MTRIFIDLTDEETQWNGELGHVQVRDRDDLSGTDMALAFGDHQLVMTVNQAITFFDTLDVWLNGGPVRETGAVRRRIHDAIRELRKDRPGLFAKVFGATYTEENYVRELEQYLLWKGLRFRIAGDDPAYEGRARRRPPKTDGEEGTT